jgi:hypothetical protein
MLTSKRIAAVKHAAQWTGIVALILSLSACGGASGDSGSSSAPPTGGATGSSSSSSSVAATNHAPILVGVPATSATVGAAYSFVPTATDADGDTLSWGATGLPSWATFNVTTHTLSGTPTAAGTYGPVTISVSDGKTSTSLSPFSIVVSTVSGSNHAPIISGSPTLSVVAGSGYSFTPSASDSDGDALTFSIANKPAWATFNTSTGALTGTPGAASRGTYANITIGVSDGNGGAGTLAGFTITVTNRAPTISGTPATIVSTNTAYSFTPTASDADGDTLTFSITNKPSWATFSTSTGALTGTPTTGGSTSGIVISVSDGHGGSAQLASFNLKANAPPTITGSPTLIVTAGASYSFTPTASDANGDTLAFSITNKPSWASFNTATGALTGTAVAGTYSNVTISVNDGSASTSLAAFTITVSASSSGTATMTWTQPTLNSDGSALTDLTGYKIYYGTSASAVSGKTSSVKTISGASTLTTTITGLTTGQTYYFSIASVATSGEGNNSNLASLSL